MAKKEPFIDLYTGDWIKDQAVSRCTPATRGIWIDLLCAMHDDGRSGKLCGTAKELARLARCSTAEMSSALTSLQVTGAADVTERNGLFTVVNRRMYRKALNRDKTRVRVARHRGSDDPCNGHVTPASRDGPSDSDTDIELSLYSGILPAILDVQDFRKRLQEWIRYKSERRESYKSQGLSSMISRAARLAQEHSVKLVMDAMERAIGNRWAGWDHPGSFGGKENGKRFDGPGQTHKPNSTDPDRGKM